MDKIDIEKERYEQAKNAAKELTEFVDKWSLSYGLPAFVIYFSQNPLLFKLILEKLGYEDKDI